MFNAVTAGPAGLTWKTDNYYYVAYVLQISIAALCPRPKIRTGVSAVEFEVGIARFPANLFNGEVAQPINH
jgi:hypothetical protein